MWRATRRMGCCPTKSLSVWKSFSIHSASMCFSLSACFSLSIPLTHAVFPPPPFLSSSVSPFSPSLSIPLFLSSLSPSFCDCLCIYLFFIFSGLSLLNMCLCESTGLSSRISFFFSFTFFLSLCPNVSASVFFSTFFFFLLYIFPLK